MSQSSWKELLVRVPLEWKDAVSNRLFELGAQAIEEKDGGEASLLKVPVPQNEVDRFREGLGEFLTALTALHGTALYDFRVEDMVEVDWAAEYRKYYFAQPLSRRFFLKPAWDTETEVPPEQIPLVLDPGQAFGTGLHGTTKVSLELIDRALKGQNVSDTHVLDVGTGSGILAIAAHKLGVGKVVGIDNDPIAIEVAEDNVRANRCEGIVLHSGLLSQVGEKFNLIVSNILLETHRELIGGYEERLAPDGMLIVSGVLTKQRAELEDLFLQRGWRLMEMEEMGEWVGATFKR